LADVDPDLARLIVHVGPPPARRPIPVDQRFDRLATAILHQQLAGAAARTITSRVTDRLGGTISAGALLELPPEDLRSCGVSGAKTAALLDLAQRVADGRLELDRAARLDDDTVIAQLVEVRGIGRWTAEMFLMGALGRHDVWPTGDLGVRAGWALLRSGQATPTPGELEPLAEAHRPYRSSVAWYCWRAVDVARSCGGELPR
jgi:3-methyladenine DNA glycosylase/8-oxoguanine DNA glycosylase